MNSQRKQIIIMVALMALLVGVLVYQFVLPKKTAVPPTSKKAAAKTSASTAAGKAKGGQADAGAQAAPVNIDIDSLLASIQEVDFEYETQRVARDVMAPLIGKVAAMEDQNAEAPTVAPATLGKVMGKIVSGIVWADSFPVAVVDNEVVEPGYEYADGTVVESIEEDRVVFRVGESLIQVELKER